jgi:4-alpha-glucanotransferase
MDLVAKAAELGIDAGFLDGQGRRHAIDPVALANLIDAMPQAAPGKLLDQPVVIRVSEVARSEFVASAVPPIQWKILAAEVIVAEGLAVERLVTWPTDIASGIYRLQLTELSSSRCEEVPLIVASAAAFQGHFQRSWILAVQLYGIRSSRN